MKRKKGPGRPAEGLKGDWKRQNVIMDSETLTKAKSIGDGNLSSGVRIAVKAYPEKKERK